MDKYHLHWFTDELHTHSMSALESYVWMRTLLADNKKRQSKDVWSALQSFLIHAAVVSKVLDPIKPDDAKKERSTALRKHLGVKDDSAFLPRAARDNLEHIDERIDRWVKNGQTKILEMVLDDRAGFEYLAKDDVAVRRVLIRSDMVFVSEDRAGSRIETKLEPVFNDLKTLAAACLHKFQTESPYNYVLAQALMNYAR
jgi:hypothetical protein